MKNLTELHREGVSDLQAKRAIQRIQQWVRENYPTLASVAQSQLILECLIEVKEEQRLRAAS